MADAEEGFSADAVKNFLQAHGARATNVQVVGHFAKYLNDPEYKGEYIQNCYCFSSELLSFSQPRSVRSHI